MNNTLPTNKVICGDAIEQLKTFPDNYFDSIVTDPPAGISFMGKKWDSDKGGRDNWIRWLTEVMTEAKRVLKPGGHALVWALPRTSHWTGFALENAGFEIRDIVHHIFGTGFPKSMNISKKIDKHAGVKRIVTRMGQTKPKEFAGKFDQSSSKLRERRDDPATPEAEKWDGWGTALKPAVECWWLVRKPISEKTVVQNVLKWRTGGLNIDECRVGTEEVTTSGKRDGTGNSLQWSKYKSPDSFKGLTHQGRFPANLIHDGSDEVLAEFAKVKITNGSGIPTPANNEKSKANSQIYGFATYEDMHKSGAHYNDSGSPARFFYCAKPSKAERDRGLEHLMDVSAMEMTGRKEGSAGLLRIREDGTIGENAFAGKSANGKNHHPTVKAQALIQYFIKLITPPGGIVLDMFAGSGSTLIAAKMLRHPYVGIEIDSEYCKIAELRLDAELNKYKPK